MGGRDDERVLDVPEDGTLLLDVLDLLLAAVISTCSRRVLASMWRRLIEPQPITPILRVSVMGSIAGVSTPSRGVSVRIP